MNPIERTLSLPKLRKSKKLRTEAKKNKDLAMINESTIKRLYKSDLKKLKTKENTFWFKSFPDRKLEKQIKELRKRESKSLKTENFSEKNEKLESSATKKLIKLQEILSKTLENSNSFSKAEILDYQRKRTPLNSNIHIEELSPEKKLSEEMIEKYKQKLEFVKTRIKVIMTTLPELKEKMQKNEKMRKKDLKLSQKLQSLMSILSLYQKSKEKLIKLINIC